MKKEVYRVLAYYPPQVEKAAVNFWVSGGKTKKDLPSGFEPADITEYANKLVQDGDVLESGMVIVKVTATVPADVVLKRTKLTNG